MRTGSEGGVRKDLGGIHLCLSGGGGLVSKSDSCNPMDYTVACQARLSMGFSRQDWSGCHVLLQEWRLGGEKLRGAGSSESIKFTGGPAGLFEGIRERVSKSLPDVRKTPQSLASNYPWYLIR